MCFNLNLIGRYYDINLQCCKSKECVKICTNTLEITLILTIGVSQKNVVICFICG